MRRKNSLRVAKFFDAISQEICWSIFSGREMVMIFLMFQLVLHCNTIVNPPKKGVPAGLREFCCHAMIKIP